MLISRDINCNTRTNTAVIHIWSIALYGAENWTLRKGDQKYLKSFEKWRPRRMEISQANRVKNEALQKVKKEYCTQNKKEGVLIELITIPAGTAF